MGVMASKAINRKQWPEAMQRLKSLLEGAGLKATVKWGSPCYAYEGANVAIVDAFKDFFVLSFFKGALLKDPKKLLVPPGANSRHVRMFKFVDEAQVAKLEPAIKAYIREAIALEKAGAKIEKKEGDLVLPAELKQALAADAALKRAFQALTPGRQRGYVLIINDAKQPATRMARIEKNRARILAGKGIHD